MLKPVDDTRMFEKIGATLADSGEYEISIIGYPSTGAPVHDNITLYPLSPFGRLSFGRLLAPWRIFRKINQVKPELIIINTPELLIVAILNRIFFGRKIIYDVLENYYRNIRFTATYPRWVRPILAFGVRAVETLSSPLVHRHLLAEKGYQHELTFTRSAIVLQNKLPRNIALKFLRKNSLPGYSKLIFSGTLSVSTGVFDAIHLCKKLHEIDTAFSLTIIGYCSMPEVLARIRQEIKDTPYVSLKGGDTLVPHEQILKESGKADIGIIFYPPNPSTESSVPTKLFEYLALRLPVLIRHNATAHQLVSDCQAGIILDENPDYVKLSEQLRTSHFTPTTPDSIFWESESQNLINSLKIR